MGGRYMGRHTGPLGPYLSCIEATLGAALCLQVPIPPPPAFHRAPPHPFSHPPGGVHTGGLEWPFREVSSDAPSFPTSSRRSSRRRQWSDSRGRRWSSSAPPSPLLPRPSPNPHLHAT